MTDEETNRYTYRPTGRDGTFALIGISPESEEIASLYSWGGEGTDEAASVEESARVICQHLNRWWVGKEPPALTADGDHITF